MFDAINAFIQVHADNPWVLVLVGLCATIDGFFPPIPSESLVVGLAAIGSSTGMPPWWALGIVAACGAWLGDNIAYLIGRRVGARWLSSRLPRLVKTLDWAERQLERRGAMIIIVARYIPVGRVAVNLTCGASGFAHRRFMGLTVLSAISWASYSVGLGSVAGAWLAHNPLLAATIGIVMAVVVGIAVDQILQRIFPYRGGDPVDAATAGDGVPVEGADPVATIAEEAPEGQLWPDGEE